MNESVSMFHLKRGQEAFDQKNTLLAHFHFEQVEPEERTPAILSALGFCVAKEQRDLRRAVALCHQAMERDMDNPLHYLHLGRIYILAKKKHLAITTFRKGLKIGRHQEIISELKMLGRRRPPLFPALGRKHPLNRYLGILSDRLGLH